MALQLPEFKTPLIGVTACANRISIADLQLAIEIPSERTEDVAVAPDGNSYVRLLREPREGNSCLHFHIDVFASRFVLAKPNCEFDKISTQFDKLIGKTLSVGFESRFAVSPADIKSRPGLIGFMQGIGINFGGATGKLAGASLKLDDTMVREVRWKHGNAPVDNSEQFFVEVLGTLGSVSVSSDLLSIVAERAFAGLKKFVLPQIPQPASQA